MRMGFVKDRGGLVEMSIQLFMPHIGSKHQYTLYLAAIGSLVTCWTVG